MKNWFSDLTHLFTLLIIASVIAIAAGAYLGVTLGMQVQASVTVLSAAGIMIWTMAWGAFLAMCLRLRRGESAFTPATERTLRIIGWCMVGLAAVTLLSAIIAGVLGRIHPGVLVVTGGTLLVIFLAVGVAAKILRGLLAHAMALEAEQEGVV